MTETDAGATGNQTDISEFNLAAHPEQPTTHIYPPPYSPAEDPVAPQPTQSLLRRRPVAVLTAAVVGVGALAGVTGGVAGAAMSNDGIVSTGAVSTTNSTVGPASVESGTVESAAAKIEPSVVTIAVTTQSGGDTGSGVVLREDGYIVTNNHVVADAGSSGKITVTFSDGSRASATVVGTDPSSDLAVVKVNKSGLSKAVFANSDNLKVGQAVIAVGAPLGLSNTVTQGIVSALNRPVTTSESSSSTSSMDAIQTDAAINPGNSGGALTDLAGRVVGINSAIASLSSGDSGSQSGNIGVGFAIPSNDVVRVANQLISSGKATHSQLGVGVASNSESSVEGATIGQVTDGSAAQKAGLQAGDVVTKIDDRVITDSDSLIVAIRSYQPGTKVTVTYVRGGQTHTTTATLDSAD